MVYSIKKVHLMGGAAKGQNGTGDRILIRFDDPNDATDMRALAGAQILAQKHGRRRQAIVAMLEAIYIRYEATGELLSASQISAALTGVGGGAPALPAPRPAPAIQRNNLIQLTAGKSASKEEIAANFIASAGAAFSWD